MPHLQSDAAPRRVVVQDVAVVVPQDGRGRGASVGDDALQRQGGARLQEPLAAAHDVGPVSSCGRERGGL